MLLSIIDAGTSIIVMSSSYVPCPRQLMSLAWSGPLLLSWSEAVWTSGTYSWTTAERTPRGGPEPFSLRCIQPRQTGVWETTHLSPLNLATSLQTSPERLSPRQANQLHYFTWCQYSRCIRLSYSSLWMRAGQTLKFSKSSTPWIWPSERRRWWLEWSAATRGTSWC